MLFAIIRRVGHGWPILIDASLFGSVKVTPGQEIAIVAICKRGHIGRALIIGFLSLTMAMGFWLAYLKPLTVKNKYRQINVGMTKAEVCNVMGGAPGDYFGGEVWTTRVEHTWGSSTGVFERWRYNTGVVIVDFDENGRVVGAAFVGVEKGEGLLERVGNFLGL